MAFPRLLRHLLVAALVAASAVWPVRGDRPRVYALTGATLIVSPGRIIDSGTIVLREGLIEAAGAGVRVPPDAVVLDAAGKWIYPGFIDPDTRLSPPGQSGEASAAAGRARGGNKEPVRGAVHSLSRIHPERRARDELTAWTGDRRHQAETYRGLGFTAVLAAPGDGILRGRSSLVLLLDDRPVSELLVAEDVAQHAAFERGSFGEGYPTSLMGAVASLRQAFLDAERHAVWSARYAADPRGMPRPERIAAYEALTPVLERRQPIVFELSDPADLFLAERIAREFGLDARISATGHEWESAERAATTGLALIVPIALPDKPPLEDDDQGLDLSLRTLRRYLDAARGPRRLHDAGVPFAFTTRGLKNLADTRPNLRKMLDEGLSEDQALAALTTVPARLLGVERILGTLEPGKIANVLVSDGPIFAKESRIERVFVDGTEYRIEEKKKPRGDPDAVVDPRGTWSVVLELGNETAQRTWTITGDRASWSGTATTGAGTVAFDRIELTGNALTVAWSSGGAGPAVEATVIVAGESFEGTAEAGGRTIPVRGTRTAAPEGDAP